MTRVYEKKLMGERLSKYDVDPVTGCWNWTGSKDRGGYGRMISSTNGVRPLLLPIELVINFIKEI